MIESITAAVGTAKATIDLFTAAKKITNAAELSSVILTANSNIADIQQGLLQAQAVIYTLMKEKGDLEAELVKASEWEDSKKAYELFQIRRGVVVYRFIHGDNSGSVPPHAACPNCFGKKRISILQAPQDWEGTIQCFECSFHFDPDEGARPNFAF